MKTNLKFTRKRLLQIGCLSLLAVFACLFSSAYLYATFAGNWASSRIIPIPPRAQLITETTYTQYAYHNRLRLYTVSGTLAEGREWFTNHRIPMEPVDEILRETDEQYCSLPFNSSRQNEYFALWVGAHFSGPTNLFDEFELDCFSACVHKSASTIDNS